MTTEQSSIKLEFRGAGKELLESKAAQILIAGPAGTGKSVAAMTKIHLACLLVPGVRALVVRKTHASLTASTLVTFRKQVAPEAIKSNLLLFYGGSGQEPAAYRYANGSTIVVGGLDKPTRMLSTDYDIIFIDEAVEVTDNDVETLLTRLRNGKLSYQQLLMATNPGPPTHHLKVRADEGRCQMLRSVHQDNPRMFNAETGQWTEEGQRYLELLKSLSGLNYSRLYLGKWTAAEGVIYEAWDESIHLIEPFKVPDSWQRYWSVDFGYVHPFVLQWWALDPDGRAYLYREIYHTKRLVEDHARAALNAVYRPGSARRKEDWMEPRPFAIICDHDAEDRATLERHLGMATVPAKKTVSDGIQAVQQRLRVQPDGKPRLFIFRNSVVERDRELSQYKVPTCTADEIPSYVWADHKTKEQPVKEYDDGNDALRYLCAQVDNVGRPRIRSFSTHIGI